MQYLYNFLFNRSYIFYSPFSFNEIFESTFKNRTKITCFESIHKTILTWGAEQNVKFGGDKYV